MAVLLALPQLQRAQRDFARKNDVAKIMVAIENYRINNKRFPNDQPSSSYITIGSDQDPLKDYLKDLAIIKTYRLSHYSLNNNGGGTSYTWPDSNNPYDSIFIAINATCGKGISTYHIANGNTSFKDPSNNQEKYFGEAGKRANSGKVSILWRTENSSLNSGSSNYYTACYNNYKN